VRPGARTVEITADPDGTVWMQAVPPPPASTAVSPS